MLLMLTQRSRHRVPLVATAIIAMLHAALQPAVAQTQVDRPPAEEAAAFSRQQLEQLLAPIALYPDALLTHVLMAASYPLQIVQLARWQVQNADIKGRALEEALAGQPWDESVKALAPFAQVVRMMSDKLDWTQQVGEAFLAQEEDVFATVQRLRDRAEAAGNLKSTKEMRITRDRGDGGTVTIIEPANPTEIYVPVYDPVVAYGAWPYPDYPPYYWYPREWRRDALFWFGTAIVAGAALWAVWDWRRRALNVNPMRYNAFFRSNVQNPAWRFNPAARKGAPFKAPVLTKKFGPIAQPTALQKLQAQQRRLQGVGPIPKSSFVGAQTKGVHVTPTTPIAPLAKSTKQTIKHPAPTTRQSTNAVTKIGKAPVPKRTSKPTQVHRPATVKKASPATKKPVPKKVIKKN